MMPGPHGDALVVQQDADVLLPWLGEYSEAYADLMEGGEELAGPRLEFGFGNGRLVATREQISQFQEELAIVQPPSGNWGRLVADFANLKRIADRASAEKTWTLFKTAIEQVEPVPQHQD